MNSDNNDGEIGYLIGGGLKENFLVRLSIPPQEIQEGAFVVFKECGNWQFYGLVTDIKLGATDPRFADEQSETRLEPRIARALHGQTLYTNLEVMPALMLEAGPDPEKNIEEYRVWMAKMGDNPPSLLPVKTVPPHHAKVWGASPGDIAEIFGKPETRQLYYRLHPRAGAPGVHQPG